MMFLIMGRIYTSFLFHEFQMCSLLGQEVNIEASPIWKWAQSTLSIFGKCVIYVKIRLYQCLLTSIKPVFDGNLSWYDPLLNLVFILAVRQYYILSTLVKAPLFLAVAADLCPLSAVL